MSLAAVYSRARVTRAVCSSGELFARGSVCGVFARPSYSRRVLLQRGVFDGRYTLAAELLARRCVFVRQCTRCGACPEIKGPRVTVFIRGGGLRRRAGDFPQHAFMSCGI
ncbi:hypothetical protein HanXRQr2_Chr12g0545621 [Helianthus annuus]|uniref:Uncharacterized protein n=1 Tax=Helianthus annuus TaxID=4232 RepID=A0A9K3HH55_HELAN|nr:hypothetical protein HanXRQr2_Chr12g0545621 [Helianthus annuus]